MMHVTMGRLTVGLFSYWIGFSWRYVKPLGRIADCGYLKFVWWPKRHDDIRRKQAMSKRRFEEWAGTGWPEEWRKLFPREDGGSGVLWPIVDNETSGQIQGFPKPEQWFAAALTPEAQRMICTALNTPRTEALPLEQSKAMLDALILIALTEDEGNEWEAVENFHACRDAAMKALNWSVSPQQESKP